MMHDRLQTGGEMENINHIFFTCSLARYAWCIIREEFGWDRSPVSISDFWETWIPHKVKIPGNLAVFFLQEFLAHHVERQE